MLSPVKQSPWRRFVVIQGILVIAMLCLGLWWLSEGSWVVSAQQTAGGAGARAGHPFPRRNPAPSLTGGTGWLNTAGPLDLQDLRGKFVLLDFWTYCCINCMHILPELKKLEHAYPNELVVIGIHSAKFAAERESQNIREAVLRYEIEHPVANDSQHKIWNKYHVTSWPSLRIIDPEGNLIAGQSGEVTFEVLDAFFKKAIPYYRRNGLLDETPIHFELEAQKANQTPLRFPGKILADQEQNRLYIADSNHNRIVVCDLAGTLLDVIGSGEIGRRDGSYASCSFDHPQGMAILGDVLYVADTENHLLRKVDLQQKQVTTIAGTGVQARGGPPARSARWSGKPDKSALNSPWALYVHETDLYIAMAGPHQIWSMQLNESKIGPYAGNGREDIVDGSLLPRVIGQSGYASFAQPSGLASDGTWLYVADSEGSSIRAVPFDRSKRVGTVIGTSDLPGARLFTFGDRDGQGRVRLLVPPDQFRGQIDQFAGALLQHPLGVVFYDGLLYVADTYNNKIKVIDPEEQTCQTLSGSGESGAGDDPAQFDEPAGITAAAGKLYVADTNNHQIRVIDLADGNRVSTLKIAGLTPPEVDER